jgi:hypothetical protein
MSQPQQPQQANKKTKQKGRAPAHQNTYAFRHNPKSKLTAKILSSPVDNCCRRCREKIVWRKTYRKYKPLTQPATCNQCHRRNITAAYHTICKSCAVDSVAFRRVREVYPTATRACEVCAKVPFDDENNLRGGDDDDEQELDLGRRLKLREVKTLERQQQRKEIGEKANKEEAVSVSESSDDEGDSEPVFRGEDDDEDDDDDDDEGCPQEHQLTENTVDGREDKDNSDEEEDPFLAAIGGKILTGKAYQEHLLTAATVNRRS